jgi:mono/diheme cytochrome c family protein
VTLRLRWRWGCLASLLVVAGCGDSFNAGPIPYAKGKNPKGEPMEAALKGKPRLQAAVTKTVNKLFGSSPKSPKVLKGMPLLAGGAYLGNYYIVAGDPPGRVRQAKYHDSTTNSDVVVEGGYALYRRHCLHCHGVAGDGDGPTGPFLWPRPRDYRRGIYKFTSTTGQKPTREDLRKTIRQGIANSSMPAFEALMSGNQIEQVLDYMIFLGIRGETETMLIGEAEAAEDNEADSTINDEIALQTAQRIIEAWHNAASEVLDPPVARMPSSSASIARGRTLFWGQTTEKLECAGCHGPKAKGDGPSWIDPATFNKYVFQSGAEPERFAALKQIAEKANRKWSDEWGYPLRPADLNQGMYKGGRRPIDLYWRISKGISGTPMPAHSTALKPEQIWDIVNFVLALPYDRELLRDAPETVPLAAPTVATRE